MNPKTPWLAACGILCAAAIAGAQCAPPSWSRMNTIPGLGATPLAMVSWDPDGPGPAAPLLVAGGTFTFTANGEARRVAFWEGSSWQPLGVGLDAGVNALAVFGGDLIAAGDFTTSGGVPVNHVARWNGTSWQPLGTGINGPVLALAVYGGELVAAGRFTTAGGNAASSIARWDGSLWQPLGAGLSWPGAPSGAGVHTLTSYGTDLIAGGGFTTAGGAPANHVARWDGFSWQALGSGLVNVVNAATVHAGYLIATGATAAGQGFRVARWDGVAWNNLGPTQDLETIALVVYNGDLIAGGMFTAIGGVGMPRIARWDGSSWLPLASWVDSPVRTLVVHGGALIAGGSFGTVDGVDASSIASWDGSAWHAMGTGLNQTIWGFAEIYGDVWAATSSITGLSASGLPTGSVLRGNGASWQRVGETFDGYVRRVIEFSGQPVAAGSFVTAGGLPANSIAAWTGSAWVPVGPGLNGGVEDLGIFNGELIAAGEFTSAGGAAANFIARWNGSTWQTLGTGTNGPVVALATFNGDLIAGGSFTSAGGVPANAIARWNGSVWSGLGGGMGSSGQTPLISALAEFGGSLVAAGVFDTAGGVVTGPNAQWNGGGWQPFAPLPLNDVATLAVFGGDLVAGGWFQAGGAGQLNGVARWDGSSWQPLGSGVSRDDGTYGTAVHALRMHHGSLLVGGNFHRAGGIISPYLARWASPLPFIGLSQPSGAGTGVQISNHWLVSAHEYYNIASLNPCAAGPGTGPYGGLCYADPAFLLQQLQLPLGAAPFHLVATGSDASFGPFALPVGLAIEAISVDVTGGVIGCISPVLPYTVY